MQSRGTTRVLPAQSSQLERYVRQRDEWQAFVRAKMTGPTERVLRDLHNAATFASRTKGTRDVDGTFRKMVSRVACWTDDECTRELAEPIGDVDACIRMAVRAHATVMALTINRKCHEVIKVPNAQAFFRKLVIDCAADHQPTTFGSTDLDVRGRLRRWIGDVIERNLLGLVPVSLFVTNGEDVDEKEEMEEREAEKKKQGDEEEGEDGPAAPAAESVVQEAETPLPIEKHAEGLPPAPATAPTIEPAPQPEPQRAVAAPAESNDDYV